jgi:hypothetical protein
VNPKPTFAKPDSLGLHGQEPSFSLRAVEGQQPSFSLGAVEGKQPSVFLRAVEGVQGLSAKKPGIG